MIHPNMATMLGTLSCDAGVPSDPDAVALRLGEPGPQGDCAQIRLQVGSRPGAGVASQCRTPLWLWTCRFRAGGKQGRDRCLEAHKQLMQHRCDPRRQCRLR
jgi:hypothetical protein